MDYNISIFDNYLDMFLVEDIFTSIIKDKIEWTPTPQGYMTLPANHLMNYFQGATSITAMGYTSSYVDTIVCTDKPLGIYFFDTFWNVLWEGGVVTYNGDNVDDYVTYRYNRLVKLAPGLRYRHFPTSKDCSRMRVSLLVEYE